VAANQSIVADKPTTLLKIKENVNQDIQEARASAEKLKKYQKIVNKTEK